MDWLNPVLPRGARSCYSHPSQGLELWGLPVVGVTGYGLTAQAHPAPSLEQPEMKKGWRDESRREEGHKLHTVFHLPSPTAAFSFFLGLHHRDPCSREKKSRWGNGMKKSKPLKGSSLCRKRLDKPVPLQLAGGISCQKMPTKGWKRCSPECFHSAQQHWLGWLEETSEAGDEGATACVE